jgi:hypothetical protein
MARVIAKGAKVRKREIWAGAQNGSSDMFELLDRKMGVK